MRHFRERNIDRSRDLAHGSSRSPLAENPEYLQGYRDGVRDRRMASRPAAGDGILGALLAIALIVGVGYFGYQYATTGQLLPTDGNSDIEINLPSPNVNGQP